MKLDSSSLIYLTKIDFLGILINHYFPVKITQSIYDEVVVQGKKKGYSDAFIIENYIEKDKILVEDDEMQYPSNLANLNLGEITAIAEVVKTNELLILDDKKARNRANELGIDYLSTDSLLIDSLFYDYILFDVFEEKIHLLAKIMLLKSSKVLKLMDQAQKIIKQRRE